MKYDNAKTWIKIAIPLGIFLIGFIVGALVVKPKNTRDEAEDFIKEEQNKSVEKVEEAIISDSKNDSIVKANIEKENVILKKNRKDAQKLIDNGIDPVLYDSLIRSNRWWGIKRKSDKRGI